MANVPGFTPGEWVSGFRSPANYLFNTPPVWRDGVRGQYYDPQYASERPTPVVSSAKPSASFTPGQYRGSNNELLIPNAMNMRLAKPGGVSGATPAGQSSAGRLPWQSGSTSYGSAGVNTSVTPRPVYSEAQTRAAVNSARADQHAAGFVPDLLKRWDRQGVSRSAGQTAAALNASAGYNQAARRAAAEIPMQDAFTNAESILGGQIARESESQGLAQVLLKLLGNQQDLKFGLAGAQNDLFGTGFSLANSLFN